ncbi:unnamed protein product [Adineta ricciae]|uniref:Calcium-transporting ATPase n=1 Tax=Adineta ricciae TaxID=249248 RepID=A0A814RYL3_ADIRI|nr:unnamed protein product [Adineta ricciae]
MTISRGASYFISTPIYYVNSKPHIGHLYSSLLADTIARWQVVKHTPAPRIIFSTGTDEHGLKIERAATAAQLTPPEFCSQVSNTFRKMFDLFSIQYTNYIRTTDESHRQAVKHVWQELAKRNLIYKGSYQGWYSVQDECFVSEDEIIKDQAGHAKLKETDRPVEWTEEKNYMFKLSSFHERIEKWIVDHKPLFPMKYNKLALIQLNELKKQGDISISREAKRLTWGIQVPNDPSQVVYVWIDALINYLTVVGYPLHQTHWPPNCQIIGKEILRFHAIYWPALLMGLDLDLPDQIVVHGHWLKDDRKMSKSVGNVIDTFDLLSKLQCDGVRYCLLREDILSQDANFNEYKMRKYLNAELANTLGNLLNRVTSSTINPSHTYPSYCLPFFPPSTNDLAEQCNQLAGRVTTAYDSYEFYHGIIAIMDVLRTCNGYVQSEQPWVLAKSPKEIDRQRLQVLIYLTLECLRICGILLQPIIPSITKQLLDVLDIDENKRTLNDWKFTVNGETYHILGVVGQGGEATVYKCEDSDGHLHAAKVFYFSRFPPSQLRYRIDGFLKEARILRYLSGRSPHFVQLRDYEYKPSENVGYMVMELGSSCLRQHMQGLPLNDQARQMYWKQIVGILRALEDAQIVHADIKPDNIIIVNNILKITDLGLAFGLPWMRQATRRPVVRGTIDYMAPEVFSHQTGFKSDVWSAGIILYEMTYGRPPYFGLFDRNQKVAAISAMTPIPFPPIHDPLLFDCMEQCLRAIPSLRPNSVTFSNRRITVMSAINTFSIFEHSDKSNLKNKFNLHIHFWTSPLFNRNTLCATLGIYLSVNGWLNYPRLAVFASIITTICLFALDFNARTQVQCFCLMSATAFFIGIYLSPLINLAIHVNPQIVMTAFLLTTIIFVCFTLSALLTQKRTHLYLGGMLAVALMNLFGLSQLIFNVNLYLGLLIVYGYILYDTQLIVERATHNDINYVKHAILLFIDLVDVFVRTVIVLLKNLEGVNGISYYWPTRNQRVGNTKMSDSNTKRVRIENETERQMEMQLLDSPPSRKKSKQMPASKKSSNNAAGGGDSSMFGVTIDQLKSLMELHGKELIEKLNSSEFNGLKGILEKLKVDDSHGLDSNNNEDLEQRRTAYGRNEIPPKPMKSFLKLCWDALHDMLLIILLVCAVVSIGLSFYKPPRKENDHEDEPNLEWIEGVAILVAVLVVVFVTAFNDWRKERQFRGLQSKIEKDQQTSVVRDGHIQQIPVADLVVGDLCFIKYGDLLPADGILVQSSDLKIDESSLTGETDLIKKGEGDDIGLLSGTHVMEGSGRMIVLGVGLNSQVGSIMSLLGATEGGKKTKAKKSESKPKPRTQSTPKVSADLQRQSVRIEDETKPAEGSTQWREVSERKSSHESKPTNNSHDTAVQDSKPAQTAAEAGEEEDDEGGVDDGKHKSVLQSKLTTLALYIGYIGMSAAFLTLICLIVRYCITTYVVKGEKASGSDVGYFISFLIQAITVVVVSVPEGLPLAVTLALAYAVRKMMTDNNLVRHLDACETMGNASTICSDKTGTLTTNRMTVVQSYVNGKHCETLPKKEEVNEDLLSLLFEAVSVNSNYTSKIEDPKPDVGGLPKQVGNKTECALLDLVQRWGGSYDKIRQEYPEGRLVKVYTFNSARKMMSTIIQRDDGYRVYTKGASEMVLTKCTSILGENNQEKQLTDEQKKHITQEVIEKMAHNALRTICIAYKDLGKDKMDWDDEEKIINNLKCIAIVGIEDPVRDEVPEAIEKCQKAGVVVRMVTGDNIMTARSIATKCGILKPDDDFLVLEGKDFNQRIRDASGRISQKKLDEVWPKLRVLARSSPQDKYNLVNGIVESRATHHREVVAVTGDGTNDGPALKRADVGFAMGIQGTDVAKQASDIILTDDNFSSIVKAMMWGRNVYDCIAKFLQFQLTANLSAGILSVVSAAAISSVPLRAVQMLWVNLVMDTLASLALATEPPTEELLNRKPYGRTKSIISPLMMRNIIGQALYQLVVMFVILYAGQYFLDVESTVDKIQHDPHAGRELSEQFTMVFNAFVLMTLFNEINSRKLHGERNVFRGIFRNPFFYCIWLFCFGAQILIVTFGGRVFSCARLNIQQWAWSILFGVGSLLWQQIILCIPTKPFGLCFSAMYRVCCPCCYKRQQKKRAEAEARRQSEANIRRQSRKSDGDHIQFSTIGQLTSATVVTEPPPVFAKFMLRKSVDRLNTEFRVINEFRTRLEELKDKKVEEAIEYKRNSRGNLLEEQL